MISKPPIKDDIFGNDASDDDDQIFQPKKNGKQPSLPTKQVDPIIKPQSTMPHTSKSTIKESDSDEEQLFGPEINPPLPSFTTTSAIKTEIKKPKVSSSDDDDLFVPSMTVKLPENPIKPANVDPLSSMKLPTHEQPKQPVVSPSVPSTIGPARKTMLDDEPDSDDDLFKPKSLKAKSKPASTPVPAPTITKTVKKTATHSESSDDPDLFSGPKPNTSVAAVKPSEVSLPSTKSDQPDKSLSSLKPATTVLPKSKPTQSSTDSEDDDKILFGISQSKPKGSTTTSQIVKVEKPADKKEPFASQPSVKTTIDEDPLLVIGKSSTETKLKSPVVPSVSAPKKPLSDNEDDDLFKASQPKAATATLSEDKKPSGVKALAVR